MNYFKRWPIFVTDTDQRMVKFKIKKEILNMKNKKNKKKINKKKEKKKKEVSNKVIIRKKKKNKRKEILIDQKLQILLLFCSLLLAN